MRIKQVLIALLITFLILESTCAVLGNEDFISVRIDGELKIFDQMPVMVNNRVLVPMRGIFEALGAEVAWDEATATVVATRGDSVIKLTIGSKNASINNENKSLDVPVQLVNGRTMVPVRFISEALGETVDWDDNTKTVLIKRKVTSTTAGVPNVLASPSQKRPVPTVFRRSNSPDDLIFFPMPQDAEEAFEKLPEGKVMLDNSSLFNPGKVQGGGKVSGEKQYGIFEKVAAEGMPFTEALRAKCFEVPVHDYSFKIEMYPEEQFDEGDVILFSFYMRKISGGLNDTGMAKIGYGLGSRDYKFVAFSNTAEAGEEWTRIFGSFKMPNKGKDRDMYVAIQPGYAIQEVEIGGFQLINYGKDVSLEDMPDTAYYKGMEENAQWRKDALERIERIRKGDINIIVQDANGNPISNADIKLNMYEHEFEFGVAISKTILADSAIGEKYRQNVVKYFNGIVLESDHKWTRYEEDPQSSKDMVDWCLANGIKHVRGHTLVWDTETPHPSVEAVINDRKALDEVIKSHIFNIAGAFVGKVQEWDVTNELTRSPSERYIRNYYEDDIILNWYNWAREAAPDAKLYMNEHKLNGANTKLLTDELIPLIDSLVGMGIDFDGIGVQAHMSRASTPEQFYNELEMLKKYGKELKITEFDFIESNKNYQANLTRDIMIAAFSHEAVTGFYSWGMWDGATGSMDRLLFDQNWELKPCGEVYEDLVYNKWWTRETGKTDQNGKCSFRGFYGDYEIIVTASGKTKVVNVSCYKGNDNTIIIKMD